MSVGARLRALRLAAGQSIEDVAAGTRLHAGLVRCLELGRAATPAQVEVLARHFCVPIEDLQS